MSFVNTKKGFLRKYLIFANEDAGYESGCEPSGCVKLEVRGGKGTLCSVIHNIKPGNGEFEYVLYLVRARRDGLPALEISAGAFSVEGGKAELEWSFDPSDVGKSGHTIDKFDVFAVIAEYADKQHQGKQDVHKTAHGVICPLAAYANGLVNWREFFGAEGQCSQLRQQDATAGVQRFYREQNTFREQVNMPAGPGGASQKQRTVQPIAQYTEQERQDVRKERNEDAGQPVKQPEQQDAPPAENLTDRAQPGTPACVQHGNNPAGGLNKGNPQERVCFGGNPCGVFASNIAADDTCGSCQFQCGEGTAETQSYADIARLKSDLERCFEISDPFHSNRSDYIWWKVTDPVSLNNILYKNGIRTPLMFNPAVMMSYYRYRHLIIGIFTHRTGRRFIVCGVPGMHMVDGKPFGEMSKWVQVEGGKPRYGALGYWLAYIDPSDGKILEIR
jgi:hypothetical protein